MYEMGKDNALLKNANNNVGITKTPPCLLIQ